MAKIVQTAGRNALGSFATEFAHFNDDVLFGKNWNNQDLDVKTRSIITVVALMASGITDSCLCSRPWLLSGRRKRGCRFVRHEPSVLAAYSTYKDLFLNFLKFF